MISLWFLAYSIKGIQELSGITITILSLLIYMHEFLAFTLKIVIKLTFHSIIYQYLLLNM